MHTCSLPCTNAIQATSPQWLRPSKHARTASRLIHLYLVTEHWRQQRRHHDDGEDADPARATSARRPVRSRDKPVGQTLPSASICRSVAVSAADRQGRLPCDQFASQALPRFSHVPTLPSSAWMPNGGMWLTTSSRCFRTPTPLWMSWEAATAPIWTRPTTLVLHGPSTRIGAVDLESKFTEAALGHLQLADYRNFAHGRHNWLAKRGETSSVLFLHHQRGSRARRTHTRPYPHGHPPGAGRVRRRSERHSADFAARGTKDHGMGPVSPRASTQDDPACLNSAANSITCRVRDADGLRPCRISRRGKSPQSPERRVPTRLIWPLWMSSTAGVSHLWNSSLVCAPLASSASFSTTTAHWSTPRHRTRPATPEMSAQTQPSR